ncbi:UDP-N-acetylglucosamine 2-epimerase (hydrolyzing) [Bacilli bacterium PM5-9]|nr:UDP-N-acetylglucosamine 2-epimerase (hydrolyzing) [Bacilli bacterium PM5-9]
MENKKILFVTGTRADYGKLKSLMKAVEQLDNFDLHILVTGMHLLEDYGYTVNEIKKDNYKNIHQKSNYADDNKMDLQLAKTITIISEFVENNRPDLIVVHGDRLEALAGALTGAINNIRVAHIEGGEISGTIDESFRHAITKMSHIHLVANEESKNRIIQLGESEDSIFVIGSPDIDIMLSKNIPTFQQFKEKYDVPFEDYAISMYHPVVSEVTLLSDNIKEYVDALIESNRNYIVVYPNNDTGSKIIIKELERLKNNKRFRIFPSIRFEYFITCLKNCHYIVGNSSAGIREAGVFNKVAIDIGSRQSGRYNIDNQKNIIHVAENKTEILSAIEKVDNIDINNEMVFGDGDSTKKFIEILKSGKIFEIDIQKRFVDIE